jgi:hypothetical protein
LNAAGRGGGGGSVSQRTLYAAAALLGCGLAPYTLLLMGGVNDELSLRATTGGMGKQKGETRALVERWGRLNLARGCMLLFSAGLGMWACVV